MEEKNDFDKIDEVMLPGFRFHPTDEELVGFYLRRKIQQRPLPIELIKQLDIYKYDPWDLPKELATTGEKEWYFYCPRDRKYRNSARPNRVTRAGFWKATGTDRPIYSSEGSKCIGLKKSLVFYKGRAARGIKTDWMMHEFRLPSYTDPSQPPKKTTDKNLPPNDSWAICRIFKKTNSIAQRALSHSWVSPSSEIIGSDLFIHGAQSTHFSSENISCASEARSAIQVSHNNSNMQQSSATSFFPIDVSTYQSINPTLCKPSLPSASNRDLPTGFMFSPIDLPVTAKGNMDTTSFLANLSPAFLGEISKVSENMDFTGVQQQFNGFSFSSAHELPGNTNAEEEKTCSRKTPSASHINNHNGNGRSVSFPFSLPVETHDAWRPSLSWDSPPCPSEMSTSYSTNKCYT